MAAALAAKMPASASSDVAVVWFRKCLRLHDNAALVEASKKAKRVCPVFVIDPHFGPAYVGVNRYRFLLESLKDLDEQLKKKYNSRLIVLRGKPEQVFAELFKSGKPLMKGGPQTILWERDTEPYAKKRDIAIAKLAKSHGVDVETFVGHTLFDPDQALTKNKGKAPSTMQGITTLLKSLGEVPEPLAPPTKLPPPPEGAGKFLVPTLKEMGYTEPADKVVFAGGETAGLARMAAKLKDTAYICNFQKPKTKSTDFNPPSTTVLSPYLKFGCVSVRRFYHGLKKAVAGKKHSEPPGSLLGQIYFREMAYLQGLSVANFDQQEGNPACKQIPWDANPALLKAWREGKTGYPFIDAVMRQLVQVGWLHHLARHAVACFLTRGDLWISWVEGAKVFDKYLLDADWAINNHNWLALSGAAPWSPPFFRVYHPVPKMDSSLNVQDPEGKFVREFVPELKKMPAKYIYAPWTAPLDVQKAAGCVIGKDYPRPVVEHEVASKNNIARFKQALSAGKRAAPSGAAASPKKRARAS